MSTRPRLPAAGVLVGPLAAAAREAGLATVGDVLDRAEYVRDLPGRSNHVLVLGGQRLFVKRTKPRGFLHRVPREAPEARGLARLEAAGVPCARVALTGRDKRLGCLTATFDLAPLRPLDELLAEGAIAAGRLEPLLDALADLVARMHAAHLHHRDLYLNHLLSDPVSGRTAVIDAERVGRHRRPWGRHVVKDLGALASSGPPDFWGQGRLESFLACYVAARKAGTGAPAAFTRRVKAKAARILRHRPRTPVGEAARPKPPPSSPGVASQ